MGFRLLNVNQQYFAVTRPVVQPRTPVGAAASADIAIGDAYALDANGNAYHAGADAVVKGICTGFELQAITTIMNGNGPISIDYATSATAASLIGCEDSNVLFEVWANTAAQNNVGGTFNLLDAAPDPTFAQSRQQLNVSGGAGAQFKLVKLLQSPADNVAGANCRVAVVMAQVIMA
jgi:hypothetical protein